MLLRNLLSFVSIACLLTACGGGSNEKDKGGSVTNAEILITLSSANIDSTGFSWDSSRGAGITKRWNLPIPVKTNGDVRAVAAMNTLEARLGVTMFDRTSIEATPNGSITRGIIFAQGTSFVPPGTTNLNAYCANVASGPNQGSYPSNFYNGTTGVINTRLYINLDNSGCIADADVVVHEFGHALGLGAHFSGFGNGPAISNLFYSDLKTLYANAPGTPKASIVITQ